MLVERWGVVVLALGTTQTLAWASSCYLVAIVADPIARELGLSPTGVFAAFSAALLLSAVLGLAVGRSTVAAAKASYACRTGSLRPV